MASLLNMSGGSLLGKGLPYDAEVEYLQSSGTQWIDTLLKNVSGCEFDVKYSIVNFVSGDYNAVAFGCRDGIKYVAAFNNTGRYNVISDFSNNVNVEGFRIVYTNTNLTSQDLIRVVGNISSAYIYINNTLVRSGNRSSQSAFALSRNITLFKNNGTSWALIPLRLFYFKVVSGNNTILDMIPVRIGTTGYMYDKVSGTLFGNAGTGAFILGPDKTN